MRRWPAAAVASVLLLLTVAAAESDQQLIYEKPDLNDSDDGEGDSEVQTEEEAKTSNGLLELQELLQVQLEARRSSKEVVEAKSSDGLGEVYKAAKHLGKAMGSKHRKHKKHRKHRKHKKHKKHRKHKKHKKHNKNIFVRLWHWLRRLMPLPALIACLAGIGLLIILLLALCIYCCCCRKSGSGPHRKRGPPRNLMYGDIDLFGNNKPPYGIINYSLEYDLKKSNLVVTVSNCQDLPKGLDSMDPYVVVIFSDEKNSKQSPKSKTSKVVRNTSNPVFNFGCSFSVKKKAELKQKVITFEIFDWDLGTRHDMVARKVVKLRKLGEGLDEILGRNVDFCKPLKKGLELEMKGPGDICISLYYAGKEKILSVTIIECKAVFLSKSKERPDLDTMPNTFITAIYRSEAHKKEQVKKTHIAHNSRNPYFNQEFVFQAGTIESLDSSSLRLTISHKTETLGIKRQIGAVTLSSQENKETLQYIHWRELCRSPNRAIARWHNFISPEDEYRQKKLKEKEEKKRLKEQEEEEQAMLELAAAEEGAGV